MKTGTAAETATQLEAELEKYPEERGEILLEAAQAWRQAGDDDRAIALLTQAVAAGGEDGGNARVELAEVLFDLDRAEEAQTCLDELRNEPLSSPVPYYLAAELLEHRGELQQALTWFDLAAARLSAPEPTGGNAEFGFFTHANHILTARRRVRRALGLPPDEQDESVQSPSDDAPALAQPAPPGEVRVLFWPRAEIPRAHEAWPNLVQHADADTAIADREAANRELSESGIARIVLVPLTTAKLQEFATRTGSDPAAEDTRLACMNEIFEEGGAIDWPPARNERCWCGSGGKYKKCCGRPVSI
ncbi:SEC-C metal-binding domain-containing protein [Amycolatopsis sp. Poz14]|uniref:SEC-C metal-binding domain-containing protein n=1 Tax=Amycolatopsis sp. Poz14 TaxID=1447705 RepID=UPI001EE93DAD|nr:SEC-C metal-binding domain-containing protein [Amycolatopsis sp. Poz14]MCG3749638.1 SEC-C domain-containing protein [Amycolatopsis sp. Poz14]